MKAQMRFQKILMLVSLIISALCIVYAISFFSGTLYKTYKYLEVNFNMESYAKYLIGADDFFYKGQSYVSVSLVMGIVLLLLMVANYITASNKRRNYYVTNYISIIATVAFALVFAVYGFIVLSQVIDLYVNGIDWEVYESMWDVRYFNVTYSDDKLSQSSIFFIFGYIIYAVVILDAVALTLNLVWKAKLMQGEKALLKQGQLKEAA